MRRGVGFAVACAVAVSPLVARGDVEPIVVCAHVPNTGAAPIARNPARFGQAYFDAINAEQGGIDGRPVRFIAFDDGMNPTGARAAVQRCLEKDPILVVGMSSRDEVWSVERLAGTTGMPYLATVHADGWETPSTCCASLSVSDERMMSTVWDSIDAQTTGVPKVGLFTIASNAWHVGAHAFAHAAGPALVVDREVQKDEGSFSDLWSDLQAEGVEIVNAFVTPAVLRRFLSQRPPAYNPQIIAPGQPFARDIVADFANGAVLTMLSDAVPAWTRQPEPGDEPEPAFAWDDLLAEQHRIFQTYSPEQSPPNDDSDWTFFIRAQQIARFLDSLDGAYDADSVRAALDTYDEDAATAWPSCAVSLRLGAAGADAFHAITVRDGEMIQREACDTTAELDLYPPTLACDGSPLGRTLRCASSDDGTGISEILFEQTLPPSNAEQRYAFDCEPDAVAELTPPPGPTVWTVTAIDCAGRVTSTTQVTVGLQ